MRAASSSVPRKFFVLTRARHVQQVHAQPFLCLRVVFRLTLLARASEWILKRANYSCEKCKDWPATEVHHLTYVRVFNELPSDLIALCKQCHAEIHWRQPANDNQMQFSFDFPAAPEED
jgi:hypothetical protein